MTAPTINRLEAVAQLLGEDPPGEAIDHGVAWQFQHGVGVISLADPRRLNAVSRRGWSRVRSLVDQHASRDDVRVIVLRGAGPRAFSAGADISEFPALRLSPAHGADYSEAIGAALRSMMGSPVPTVAMLKGLTVGGGLELAAACDVRIAAHDLRTGLPIGRLGVTLGLSEASALVRLIGAAQLKHLVYSGLLIGAEDARRIGLVQELVPAERLVERVSELVAAICSASQPTMRATKRVVDMTGLPATSADLEWAARLNVEIYGGPDLAEGVAAFLENRAPDFPSTREGA